MTCVKHIDFESFSINCTIRTNLSYTTILLIKYGKHPSAMDITILFRILLNVFQLNRSYKSIIFMDCDQNFGKCEICNKLENVSSFFFNFIQIVNF